MNTCTCINGDGGSVITDPLCAVHGDDAPSLRGAGHVDCPCWATGEWKWQAGCPHHPVENPWTLPIYNVPERLPAVTGLDVDGETVWMVGPDCWHDLGD